MIPTPSVPFTRNAHPPVLLGRSFASRKAYYLSSAMQTSSCWLFSYIKISISDSLNGRDKNWSKEEQNQKSCSVQGLFIDLGDHPSASFVLNNSFSSLARWMYKIQGHFHQLQGFIVLHTISLLCLRLPGVQILFWSLDCISLSGLSNWDSRA